MSKDFVQDILDEFGEGVLSQEDAKNLNTFSTGSLSLDSSIGVGGIPRGKVTEIFGPEGTGKTTIALNIAKNAIEEGSKVLYIDVENLLDNYLVEGILGMKLPEESLLILHPDTAEDAFTIGEMGINSKEFGLIVLDSVGALAPKVEKEKEMGDRQMGLTPQLLTKFLRRNIHNINQNKVAFVFINQVRDKISLMAKGYDTPGGHALKHFSAVRISLSRGEEITQNKTTIGINVKFTIKKNKLAPPFRSYIIPLKFGQGLDFYRDFINFSKNLGVIKQGGPFYKFNDETLGKGFDDTVEHLKNNKETLDKIKEACYNMSSKNNSPLEIEEESEDIPENE
jgi:recombination protein RecA